MKRFYFSALLIVFAAMCYATNGHISSNTVWSSDLTVTGDLWVDENVTLTIQAGVTVYFPKVDQNADSVGDIDFFVNGRLVILGNEANKVRFRSLEANPGKRDWGGIQILTPDAGSISSLNHLEISGANRGLLINGKGASTQNLKLYDCYDYGIRVAYSNSPSSFTNLDIRNGAGYGMQVEAGNITITNALIYKNNSYGFKGMGTASLNISGMNSTTNNGHGIWLVGLSTAIFEASRSVSNKQYGVLIESGSPSFTNCQILSNVKSGVRISGTTGSPSFSYCTVMDNAENGFMIGDRNPSITYSTITQNRGSGITLLNANPTVNYCNIFGNLGEELMGSDFIANPADTVWRRTSGGSSTLPTTIATAPVYIRGLTYIKDADEYYSSSYYTYQVNTRIIINSVYYLEDIHSYYTRYSYNMPEITVSGNVNQIVTTNSSMNLNMDFSIAVNPRVWVTQVTMNHLPDKQVLVFNTASKVANLQYNWWGQITGVDNLIYQLVASTANYETMQTAYLPASLSNLPNEAPSFTLLTPAVLTINPQSVDLNFTAMDIDNNARISLYYSSGQDFNGTLITDQLFEDTDTSHTWNVSAVTPGIYWIYGAINDGSNPILYDYAPERVVVGDFRVWIPNDLYASATDTLVVPVKIRNVVQDYDIIAYQMNVTFNQNVVSFLDMDLEGTLSEDWTLNFNNTIPGQITLNAFSTNELASSGDMLKLIFRINNNQPDNQFTDLTISDCVLNGGYPSPVTSNGRITVYNKYNITGGVSYYNSGTPMAGTLIDLTGRAVLSGETNASGQYLFAQQYYGNYTITPGYDLPIPEMVITPYDASLVARYALGLVVFDANQIHAADVNADAQITVYDAALIARYSVGLIDELPAGLMKFTPASASFVLNNVYTPRNFVGIAYGDPSGNWYAGTRNQIVDAPQIQRSGEGVYKLTLSTENPFYSYLLKLQYDPELVELLDISYNPCLEGFQRVINHEGGLLQIASYGINAANSTEAIIELRFRCDANELPIEIISSLFDEENAIQGWTSNEDITASAVISLAQNYPNPFNPSTSISYALPRSSDVKLSIYNMKGQFVHSLVNAQQPAGIYTVKWDAAGHASGMYLYRLQVGEKIINRKMLLMK